MTDSDELILELAKSTLQTVEPAEVPLLDAVGPDLLRGVDQHPRGDGSLGFGGLEAMTPAALVLLACKAAVEVLADVAKKYAVEEGVGLLRRIVDRLLGKPPETRPVVLEASDVHRARSVARDQLIAAGVEEQRASSIADAIAARLRIPV